jgi:uncharacterized protein (DUF952 family)
MPAATIYKLLTRGEWEAARAVGVYRGSAHDARDGFIHFSTAAQLAGTARKHFVGVPDLVLLAVDVAGLNKRPAPHPVPLPLGEGTVRHAPSPIQASPLPGGEETVSHAPSAVLGSPLPWGEGQSEGSELRWEPSRGGDLFPHLYADLPLAAVKTATAISLSPDGDPIIPGGLEP